MQLFREICQDKVGKQMMEHYLSATNGNLVYDEHYALLTMISMEIANDVHKPNKELYKHSKKLTEKMYKFFERLKNDTNRYEGAE